MKKITKFLGAALFLIVAGCSDVNTIDNFEALSAGHQSIAILPFWVSWSNPDGTLIQKQKGEKLAHSGKFQQTFYKQLTARENTLNVQNITQTNQRLKTLKKKDQFNKQNLLSGLLANKLGVDALVLVNVKMYPAVLLSEDDGIEIEQDTSPNRVDVKISLMDGQAGQRIWWFDDALSDDSISLNSLVDELLAVLVENFPYLQDN